MHHRLGRVLVIGTTCLWLAALAGCGQTQRLTPPRELTPISERDTTAPVVAVYGLNEEAPIGDIVHTVAAVETLAIIPASATLPEWKLIAEDLPAADGFRWIHIIGTVTNHTKQTQTLDTTSVVVVDADDNEYSISTTTTIYVESDKSPVYLSVQPTQTIEWEGYFQVPVSADGLMLKADDLDFLSDDYILIELGL